jgi:hydroxymethylbilane synthase
VASVDGKTILKSSISGSSDHPEKLGNAVAEALLAHGAGPLLAALSEEEV